MLLCAFKVAGYLKLCQPNILTKYYSSAGGGKFALKFSIVNYFSAKNFDRLEFFPLLRMVDKIRLVKPFKNKNAFCRD